MNSKFFCILYIILLYGYTVKLNELDENLNSLIDLNSLDNVKNQIIEILNNNDYISLNRKAAAIVSTIFK